MQELELTWGRSTAVWWLIFWRGTIGAVLMGAVAGFIIGFAGSAAGIDQTTFTVIAQLVGAVIGFVWFMFVVRMALRKHYGDFRIALVPKS